MVFIPLFKAILPVRATSMTPNRFRASWRASVFPGSPAALRMTEPALRSTTLARNISAVCKISFFSDDDDALTLISSSSLSSLSRDVTSCTYFTLTSLEICFTRLFMARVVQFTTTVKRALSTFRPTARDSMLKPLLEKTPETLLMIPLSSPTNMSRVCFFTPSLRGTRSTRYTSPPLSSMESRPLSTSVLSWGLAPMGVSPRFPSLPRTCCGARDQT
mmetsp:Transcript_4065/g.11826  ORF Transcript_4065/g.11826 Transcript_4065/m.11826 type:complete len:218 (-) Transcript_4065:47-700(-)